MATATTKPIRTLRATTIEPPAIEIVKRPRMPFGRAADLLGRVAIHGIDQADAIADERIEWFWDGYIARESYVLVAGRPGEGKTSSACLLAVAAAAPPDAPVSFIGARVAPVAEGTFVFLVLEENSRKSAVQQIDRAIEAWKLDRAYVWSRIVLLARAGIRGRAVSDAERRNPPTDDAWSAIVHVAIEHGEIGLLILDSMARVFGTGRGANVEEDQAEIGTIVTELQKSGTTVLVIVHVRKNGNGAITLEDVAGSHQRAALADAVIAVEGKKKKGQTIASTIRLLKQREISDEWPEPKTLSLAKRGDVWRIIEDDAEDESGTTAGERIAALLDGSDDPMSAKQIRDALEMSGKRVAEEIRKLGRRVKVSTAKRGNQGTKVYSLRRSWAEVMDPEGEREGDDRDQIY